jgi:hypothetical protein
LHYVFSIKNFSQEIEPRIYANVPDGMNTAAFSYIYTYGSVIFDASSPLQDLNINSHAFVGTYLRSFGFFGKLARVQINVPYVALSGTAKLRGEDTSASRNGFADTRFRIGINLIGSPALPLAEFQKYKEDLVIGTSFVVSIPTGQYLTDKLINIGTHRWGFKPEIGISKRFGPWNFEFYTGVWFFTKNEEFLKTNELSQEPLFTFQSHISYLFPSRIWIAFNGGYADGGETKLNGMFRNDLQKNFRLGGTLAFPVAPGHSIKFVGHTGVYYRSGQNATSFSLNYLYTWF